MTDEIMHSYATNSRERKRVPFVLGGATILLTYALIFSLRPFGLAFPSWTVVLLVMGVYGVLHQLFSKWLWRSRISRLLRLTSMPDLAGDWSGTVESTHKSAKGPIPISVRIDQDWSRMLVRAETEKSTSKSRAAAVLFGRGSPELSYEYLNEPLPGDLDTMAIRRGNARLRLEADSLPVTLYGEYHSTPGSTNYGAIELRKVE